MLEGELLELARKFCREELRAWRVYEALASQVRDEAQRSVLLRIAEQERRHYEFWRRLAGGDCGGDSAVSPRLVGLAYKILGPVFVLQLLERGEEDAVRWYRRFLELARDEELARRVEEIMREEEEHEVELIKQIEDVRVKYMGFIALGLADAIVEISGVHAGFLGATSKTIIAGIAGLVVGFSAALSMAGAAYVQAKHTGETHPPTSALATGVSYIFSVILLALPYFLTSDMYLAFAISLTLAAGLIAAFTFYSVVVEGKSFTREFLESALLMLGTAFGSFLFGKALGILFGIEHIL